MIVGTGVDLCEVDRMRKVLEAPHGAKFQERVFTPGEIAYASSKANRYERFAARFAAKEAGMKALGTGWGKGLSWHDLEVIHLPNGRPSLRLHGKAAEVAAEMRVSQIALSLSHTKDQAIAMVILESADPIGLIGTN